MEKIFDSNYAKAKLEQVAANAIHMNSKDRTKLLRLLQYFEDLLDGTLGDWEIEPINLELKPYSKPFSCIYYPVPRTNNDTFCKEIQRLVKIGVLTLVQQYQ